MRYGLGVFFAGLAVILFDAEAGAFELRCDEGIVEMNDSKYAVAHKCGEPAFKDLNQASRIAESKDAVIQKTVAVEDWLYNFGPRRFVVVLTFEDDALVGMRKFGKGRSEGAAPDFNKKVDIGDPAVRLLLLYGPPSHKEERAETIVVSLKNGATVPRQRIAATWTYNLGPHRFMRVFKFINGRLVEKRRGNKGF